MLYTFSTTPYPISQAVSLASAQFHAPASQSKIAAATQETAGVGDGV